MPNKRNIKPAPASVAKPATSKPAASKRAVTVPGATTAQAATGAALASGQPTAATTAIVNAASVPAAKPRASAIVRNFCRKANATNGRAKTSADTLSARDAGASRRALVRRGRRGYER